MQVGCYKQQPAQTKTHAYNFTSTYVPVYVCKWIGEPKASNECAYVVSSRINKGEYAYERKRTRAHLQGGNMNISECSRFLQPTTRQRAHATHDERSSSHFLAYHNVFRCERVTLVALSQILLQKLITEINLAAANCLSFPISNSRLQ